jgi:hypothetical protein
MTHRTALFLPLLLLVLLSCSQTPSSLKVTTPTGDEPSGVAFYPPSGTIRDEKHGRELRFAYGALSGTGGHAANGVATAHELQDGFLIIALQLNIAPAEEGYFYRAMIEADGVSTPMGNMTNSAGDARHSLRFEDRLVVAETARILILKQPDGQDIGSVSMVAQGVLRLARR